MSKQKKDERTLDGNEVQFHPHPTCLSKDAIETLNKDVNDLRALLNDAGEVMSHIMNGHGVDEIKQGLDAMVELGKVHYVVKKYKFVISLIIGMAVAGFFGLDVTLLFKVFKGVV
jgi:hypothetical protein